MKKSDLRSGMIVEDAEGNQGIVLLNSPNGDIVGGMGGGEGIWFPLAAIDENFNRKGKTSFERERFEKIYSARSNCFLGSARDLIWERKNEVVLSLEDIAEKFGVDVNQIKINK